MFNPSLATKLAIDGRHYSFAPHPAVPTLVWGQEGRHAIVFKIVSGDESYGLKVFRPVFRHPGLIVAADSLWTYHELPGMLVCKQAVITKDSFPELVGEYEDLDYAMVMPWIDGETWFDILEMRQKISLDQSRAMAESMAWVLYALELNQLAHCDLSSGNVIIPPQMDQIHLVDVEDLYSPWLESPPLVPAGTPGYQHREASKAGQWGPGGDRFAGAVLMAEMLGWAHPEVRKQAWGESYFAPAEMQQRSERYDTLLQALHTYGTGFAEVFAETWLSEGLNDCLPLKTWYDLLDALPRDPVASWAPISAKDFKDEIDYLNGSENSAKKKAAVEEDSQIYTADEKGETPDQSARRIVFTAVMIVLLLACCLAALGLEWSLLRDILK